MKRRLFNLLTAVSLVMFIASLALWVRTLLASEYVIVGWSERSGRVDFLNLLSSDESLLVTFERTSDWALGRMQTLAPASESASVTWSRFVTQAEPQGFWPLLRYEHLPVPESHYGLWSIGVRPWLPVLIFSVLPILWAKKSLRQGHLRRRGHCSNCGYDLRATPERCPECGTAVGPVERAVVD